MGAPGRNRNEATGFTMSIFRKIIRFIFKTSCCGADAIFWDLDHIYCQGCGRQI